MNTASTLLTLLTSLALSLLSTAEEVNRPNIILFVTDDQSPIAGCYGSPVIQTPHMDALAKDGTMFTNAYATSASCSASRSVILTGQQNHANGQYGHSHDYNKFTTFAKCGAISLPNQLRHLGYRVAHIGKLHVAPQQVYEFGTYLKTPSSYKGKVKKLIRLNSQHNSPVWIESCKALINEESDQPFFLNFWTKDPHRAAEYDESAPEKYKPNLFGNPPVGEEFPGTKEVVYDPAKVIVPPFLPDTIECRREIAQYYQSCTRTDKALGRLIAELKKAGKYDNTMIIYTSDHGVAFPGAKTTVYEAGLRVPFIVKMPNTKAGVVNDALISHTDITPTLVDIAGGLDHQTNTAKTLVKVPKPGKDENQGDVKFSYQYHGKSWKDLVGKEHGEGWDRIFGSHTFHEIQMYYPMRTIRERKFKLIMNIADHLTYPSSSDLWVASTWKKQYDQGEDALFGKRTIKSYLHRPKFELYNIQDDPDEIKNLASDPEYAKTLEDLKAKLKKYQQETDDPWVQKWVYE